MEGRFIVFYDIADPGRLRRVEKIMKDYGTRVQRSFYEALMDETAMESLRSRLKRVIDPARDGIKIVRLCGSCANRRLSAGRTAAIEPAPSWTVI